MTTEAGRLEVVCWCGRYTVFVAAELVQKGKTGSCGAGCHPGCYFDDSEAVRYRDSAQVKRDRANRTIAVGAP